MPYTMRSVNAVFACMMLATATLSAEDKRPAVGFPLPDMKTDVPRWVGIIDELGKGQLESALDLIEAELVHPFPASQEPFENDARERWRAEFKRLAELNAKFESVDFMGYQAVSSATRALTFIGHGEYGPIQFRMRVFRYKNKWNIANLSYQGNWDQIEADNSYTRLETPITYPLETPVIESDE